MFHYNSKNILCNVRGFKREEIVGAFPRPVNKLSATALIAYVKMQHIIEGCVPM